MDTYELLKNKIIEFGEFLKSVSKSKETIEKIDKLMLDLDRLKIAMFITFLNKQTINDKFDKYDNFSDEVKIKFNNYIDYFIECRQFL